MPACRAVVGEVGADELEKAPAAVQSSSVHRNCHLFARLPQFRQFLLDLAFESSNSFALYKNVDKLVRCALPPALRIVHGQALMLIPAAWLAILKECLVKR